MGLGVGVFLLSFICHKKVGLDEFLKTTLFLCDNLYSCPQLHFVFICNMKTYGVLGVTVCRTEILNVNRKLFK